MLRELEGRGGLSDGEYQAVQELQRTLLLEKLGVRLVDYLRAVRDLGPGDDWKIPGLRQERDELRELGERVVRRFALEAERHTAPDGTVDWAGAVEAVRDWEPEPAGGER